MGTIGDTTQFSTLDQQTDPRFFIEYLDAGNALEDIKRLKQVMIAQLELHDGVHLLDIGCGTGDDVRALAPVVSPRGQSVGVDASAVMIAEAQRRHAAAGLPVAFVVGHAQHLAFADASFDRCRAERVLMHLDDPARAVAEMARVVRPGGKVVVFDMDWGMMFVDSPYQETTRTILQAFSDGMRHGWIGRSLPRLCQAAGLADVTCVPHTAHLDYAFAHRLFDGHLTKVQATGVVSADDCTRWWQHLAQAEAAGQFHAGQLGFVVSGRKR
jgi:ubiquinone/menaquinone biosynthesis C-methylase UbiE